MWEQTPQMKIHGTCIPGERTLNRHPRWKDIEQPSQVKEHWTSDMPGERTENKVKGHGTGISVTDSPNEKGHGRDIPVERTENQVKGHGTCIPGERTWNTGIPCKRIWNRYPRWKEMEMLTTPQLQNGEETQSHVDHLIFFTMFWLIGHTAP